MMLKLDISKVYDHIESPYLEVMMKKLMFGDRWISLILMCVTTVSFLVMVTSQRRQVLKPKRGELGRETPFLPSCLYNVQRG